MSVSSTTTKVSYAGNGSTTVFAYTFKIFAAADLEVIVRAANGTETTKTLTTHYSVSGAGEEAGGNVTMVTAPASGETLFIRRNLTLTQGTDYVENDPFPANSHENALDRLTFITQGIQEELDRAIKASKTNTISSVEFAISAADRANKIFAFDGSGDLSVTQELGTFQGNWAAATDYNARDIVKDTSNNNIYLCNTSHTSSGAQPLSSNADSAKWDLLVDAASATSSASAAASSASAAATSESNAASSAAAASTSASNAATSESNASTYESNAATSESNAASSASSASASASAAAVSAATAATYAGTQSVDRFNGTGSQTDFTLSLAPETENNTSVYVSGIYQQKDTYSISGTTLTFSSAPPSGTGNIEVMHMSTLPVGVLPEAEDGSAAAPSIAFAADTDTGVYRPGANQIGFTTGGTSAMTIDAAQDISIGGSVEIATNLAVDGNLTVSGTTTTVDTTNTVISDSLIELNNGAASNPTNDLGIIMERGSTGDNAIIAWDESADGFIVGTTTATGASTGALTISAAPFQAGATTVTTLTASGDFVVATNDLFVDVSENRIGIQQPSPSNALHIGNTGVFGQDANSLRVGVNFSDGDEYVGGNNWALQHLYDRSTGDLKFRTGVQTTAPAAISWVDELHFDFSENEWDFQANAITTTGTLSAGATTISGALGGGGLHIDSSTGAGIDIDRGANTNGWALDFATAGVDQWSIGNSAYGNDDLFIRDVVNASNVFAIRKGTTGSYELTASGVHTFSGTLSTGAITANDQVTISESTNPYIRFGYSSGGAQHRIQWDSTGVVYHADPANGYPSSYHRFYVDSVLALTLDSSQNAIFAGTLSSDSHTIDGTNPNTIYKVSGVEKGYTRISGGVMQINGTDQLDLRVGGANFLSASGVDATFAGNAAIGGATLKSWGAGFDAFQLENGGLFTAAGGTGLYVNDNSYWDGTNYKYSTTAGASQVYQNGGNIRLNVAASGTAGTNITFTKALEIGSTGDATFSGRISSAARIQFTGFDTYTSGLNGLYRTSANGLLLAGSGSSTDFVLVNAVGQNVLSVPTGTRNATFDGRIAATGFSDSVSDANYLDIEGGVATSGSCSLQAAGTDANIGLYYRTKGSSVGHRFFSNTSTEVARFYHTQATIYTDATFAGDVTVGSGGTGAATANIKADGGTAAAGGGVFELRKNGTFDGGVGHISAIIGSGTSDTVCLYATAGTDAAIYANDVLAATFSGANATFAGTFSAGATTISTGSSGAIANANADELVLESNGNAGISVLTPNTNTGIIYFADSDSERQGIIQYAHSTDEMSFYTNGTSGLALTIDSSQNVGIGTASPAYGLDVNSTLRVSSDALFDRYTTINYNSAGDILKVYRDSTGTFGPAGGFVLGQKNSSSAFFDAVQMYSYSTNATAGSEDGSLVILTRNSGTLSESMRIDFDGNVLVGTNVTSPILANPGVELYNEGRINVTRSLPTTGVGAVFYLNRKISDGVLVSFRQDGSEEGNISVSGTTVSYNGGNLSRWSRLPDDSKDTSIVKGTVMTNLDEMVAWGDEENEQLNKMAVSSVEGDPNVAGVFVNWDNGDDWNDMNVAMTGDMVIRIAAGITVQRGDLLMSAGDGTAKPQGDDIVRAKTIAKVTSTHVSHTYGDGSYCVPCVLMAC